MADDETRGEINRLYWQSDASVADIADRLGVSRRAIYDAIEPRPAGAPCPDCGAELGFRNRTGADRGETECGDCGRQVSLDADAAPPELEQERVAARLSPLDSGRPVGRPDAPLLGGALLAGLAAGAAAGFLLRRR